MVPLFLVISILGVLAALGTVLARNLIHAALFLVAFFFLIACQFVLLEAEFLAAMQVLVYIGAVAILLMFGIMLTRNIQGDETTGGRWYSKVPAALVSLGMLAVLILGIQAEPGSEGEGSAAGAGSKAVGRREVPAWTSLANRPSIASEAGDNPQLAAIVNNMSKAVGDAMLTRYVVAFEVAGLLLTAALVGAIALVRQEGLDERATRVGAKATVDMEAAAEHKAGSLTTPSLTTTTAGGASRNER